MSHNGYYNPYTGEFVVPPQAFYVAPSPVQPSRVVQVIPVGMSPSRSDFGRREVSQTTYVEQPRIAVDPYTGQAFMVERRVTVQQTGKKLSRTDSRSLQDPPPYSPPPYSPPPPQRRYVNGVPQLSPAELMNQLTGRRDGYRYPPC